MEVLCHLQVFESVISFAKCGIQAKVSMFVTRTRNETANAHMPIAIVRFRIANGHLLVVVVLGFGIRDSIPRQGTC